MATPEQSVEVIIVQGKDRIHGLVTVSGGAQLVQEAVDRIRKGNPPPK